MTTVDIFHQERERCLKEFEDQFANHPRQWIEGFCMGYSDVVQKECTVALHYKVPAGNDIRIFKLLAMYVNVLQMEIYDDVVLAKCTKEEKCNTALVAKMLAAHVTHISSLRKSTQHEAGVATGASMARTLFQQAVQYLNNLYDITPPVFTHRDPKNDPSLNPVLRKEIEDACIKAGGEGYQVVRTYLSRP